MDSSRRYREQSDITLAYQALSLTFVSLVLTSIYGIRAIFAYVANQYSNVGIFLGLGFLALSLFLIPKTSRDYQRLGFVSALLFPAFEAYFIYQKGEHFFLFLLFLPLICIYTSFLSGIVWGIVASLSSMLWLTALSLHSSRSAIVETSFTISLMEIFLYLLVVQVLVVLVLFSFQHTLNQGNEEIKFWRLLRAKKSRTAALAEGLGKLAHEVNNPLAILHSAFARYRGLHDQGRGGEPYVKQLSGYMQDSTDRILKVLDNLRVFAGGDFSESKQVLDLPDLMGQLRRMFYETTRSSGVQLQFVPFTQPKVIHGRPKPILFILAALIENALEASVDEPRVVTLRCISEESFLRFEIEDSGVGISDELSERIFQPFVSTKTFGQSLGMNLSICHGLCSELNGQMGFLRKPKGTLFWLKLPIV